MNNFDDLLNNKPEGQKSEFSRLSNEEYAEKKQAERDALYELADNASLAATKNGAAFQQYLDMQAQLNRYSATNTLLVMSVNPKASHLGDFDYWKDRDCSIIKDEKGIAILEPNEYTKNDGSVGIGYNVKKVFDISQVDTQNLKTEPQANIDNRQILRALVQKAPMAIKSVDELPNGKGAMTDPQTGDVYVLKGMEFNDTFRSLANEIAYAEVDLDKSSEPQFTAYCASYILCKKNGVDTKNYDFDDVGHIFEKMSPQEIKAELSQIRNIANDISVRMARHLDVAQKAEKSSEAR